MRLDTAKRISNKELEAPVGLFTDSCPFVFQQDLTVEQAISILQAADVARRFEYFYVTDQKNVLEGLVTLSDLLYNPSHMQLGVLVDREVIKVYEDEPLEKGLQLLTHHQLLVLPVVNNDNQLVGILEILPNGHFQRTKKIHHKYFKEDIYQFIGFSIQHRKWQSVWTEYRLRMPWLLCNVVGGLVCAAISQKFRLTLEQFVILAFFIPLVLTLSESISIQSMTLSLRFLHLRHIHWLQVGKRAFVEMKSSFLLGITSALLITGCYFLWSHDLGPVLGIALSIIIAMMASALFGALFPILLHQFKLDPKVAAGPVVLMISDIMTIAIYLILNTLILIH